MSSALEGIPLHAGARVLAEHPCGLLALDKPADILSHPNGSEDNARSVITANYSLDEEAYHVRDGKGGIRKVWLINRLDWLKQRFSLPILLGTSRKSFIPRTLDRVLAEGIARDLERERLAGTAASLSIGVLRGARLVRVHDVADSLVVVRLTEALLASSDTSVAFRSTG